MINISKSPLFPGLIFMVFFFKSESRLQISFSFSLSQGEFRMHEVVQFLQRNKSEKSRFYFPLFPIAYLSRKYMLFKNVRERRFTSKLFQNFRFYLLFQTGNKLPRNFSNFRFRRRLPSKRKN